MGKMTTNRGLETHADKTGGETYRAGLPTLGARLLAAAGLVHPGSAVADVGCDHGKLAVWLAMAGRATRVIAVDLNPMPLARARALVQRTGTAGKVECRLGNGLAPVGEGEVQTVIIAGMSGETMIEILAAAPWLRQPGITLVLVPATRAAQLRRWLYGQGFALQREVPTQEKGRFYTALSAAWAGQPRTPGPLFCTLGLVPETKDAAAKGYIEARLANLQKQAKGRMNDEERRALAALTAEVERILAAYPPEKP